MPLSDVRLCRGRGGFMSVALMLLGVALAKGCAGGGGISAEARESRPNIVLIVSDDLRADFLGVSGNEKVHTPNLDALARRGVYFTKATCYVAQCCPWRAMMVTGLTPHQSGYLSMDIQRSGRGERDGFAGLPTLPGLLRDAGYRTVLVGKWHIKPDPWKCGFGEVREWFPEGMGPYTDPELCCGESRETKKTPGFVTEIFADDAIGFLKSEGAKEKPFFLWLATTAPHEPCEPTPERIGALYEGKTAEDLVQPGIALDSARWRDKWVAYYRAVSHLDEQVGRVLAALGERGLAGNTVVVFVSDSGIMMGRRGIDSKVVPYEDSVRAPIIVFDPRRKSGHAVSGAGGGIRSDAAVSAIDLPPTVLGFAGVEAPRAWPGRGLGPLLEGKAETPAREAVCEWADDSSALWGQWAFRSLFDGRWKLIVWEGKGRKAELYDVGADPHEERDLAGSERSRVGEMRGRLRERLERTGDGAAGWAGMNEER